MHRNFVVTALALVLATECLAQTPTLRTIRIDGDLDDWQAVLVNPIQVTRDGDGSRIDCANSTDLDCPVQSAGRDLRVFAWTYDATHLYLYSRRQGSSSNSETFWFYMDLDQDELMGSSDLVLRVRYQGSSGSTEQDLYRYIPASPTGDPMVDGSGRADGYTMPGTLATAAVWSEGSPNGGDASGGIFEERVPWSVLGVPSGTPINFHVSSSNSANPGSLPGQIDDNLGQLGGGLGTFGYSLVRVEPDRSGTAAGGAIVSYAHEITNTGTQARSFALSVLSLESFVVSLYTDPDRNGVGDELIAVDVAGDGDFTDTGDSISAGWDADADGFPETPTLQAGESFAVVMTIATPAGASDLVEETELVASVPGNEAASDSAIDTTHLGLVIVRFDQERGSMPGQSVSYPVQVCSNGPADVFDLTVRSTLGLTVQLYSDTDCNGAANALLATDVDGDGTWDSVSSGDTDGDRIPDTGALSGGQCRCFVVQVSPDATVPLGFTDVTTLTARGSSTSSSATAELSTRVAGRIELEPDYVAADGTNKFSGVAKPVFFAHVARNNGSIVDQVDFAAIPPVNDQGWTVKIWSDPNGDGSIADGDIITRTDPIPPFGGTVAFVVEVEVPASVPTGVTGTTVVTGVSVLAASDRDTVTDEVEIAYVATYSDPLYAFATQFFAPCDTIYVAGSGLEPRRGPGGDPYDLLYVDASGRTVRFFAPFVPDDLGEAFDEYTLAPGDLAGTWSMELRKNAETFSRAEFFVESAGVVSELTTDRALYPISGAPLTVTTQLRNDNVGASFRNTRLTHVVLAPGEASYLDAASGTFVPYSGAEVTRSVDVSAVQPGETSDDLFTVPSVTYPMEGLYTVLAQWLSPCGSVLVERSVTFVVGSGAEDCGNGADDDGDGFIDCADPECVRDPACFERPCDNNRDDDNDGFTDCEDIDCVMDPACPERACANLLDDDGDGLVDCADPDCASDPACIESDCMNNVDDDGDGLIDCVDPDCDSHPACGPETNCSNGQDDDFDGPIDCADIDCAADRACENDDTDGDTVPNGQDCAPLDPGAHHVPDEDLLVLTVTKPFADSTTSLLAWTDLRLQAGTALVHDVISGLVSELWQDRGFVDTDGDLSAARCFITSFPGRSVADVRRVPGRQDAYWYLVAARNVCGSSGWGEDSEGQPRVMPAGGCFDP